MSEITVLSENDVDDIIKDVVSALETFVDILEAVERVSNEVLEDISSVVCRFIVP